MRLMQWWWSKPFDTLDTNYDDSLSRAEFLAGALRNNPSSRDSLVDIFTSIDKDADGEILAQ